MSKNALDVVGELSAMTREYMSQVAQLKSDRAELIEFLHEFVNAGVSFEDPRIDYIEIQINSDTMSQARALLARLEGT